MQKRILILDDDESVCDTLDAALRYFEFDVKTSGPPKDFWNLIEEYHPDILLVDYLLQSVNGVDLCHQIRENPDTSTIPVVMISAYAKDFKQSEIDEFDAVLHKPFSLDELVQTVNHLTDM